MAEGAWQQLMSTLHDYLIASESDSRTSALEEERMDVEVSQLMRQRWGSKAEISCLCQLVQAIRSHLVPAVAKEEPRGVVQELSEILSKGSTHIVKDPLKSKFVCLYCGDAT